MTAGGTRRAARVAVGVLGGLAWGAAFRAYMAEITGAASAVTWAGTFVGVLLPSAAVGAAVAVASVAASRRSLRWCAAAPVLLAVTPLLLPGQLVALVTTGLGGGGVGVGLAGLAGGYALGGRRVWLRILGGVFAAATVVGVAATVPGIGGDRLSWTSPRGAWIMVLGASLVAVLGIAASVPFRRLAAVEAGGT